MSSNDERFREITRKIQLAIDNEILAGRSNIPADKCYALKFATRHYRSAILLLLGDLRDSSNS